MQQKDLYLGWQKVNDAPLGEGGQSTVFLARNPARVKARGSALAAAVRAFPVVAGITPERVGGLAELFWKYAQPDDDSELGALKIFKMPNGTRERQEAVGRLRAEIEALTHGGAGLIALKAATPDPDKAQWIVTEYIRTGTVEENLKTFRGDALGSLKAVRSLAVALSPLHQKGIVHRDVKPANTFCGRSGDLILGDFGIVYLPNQPERQTKTQERVGPRDFMPVWGDLGERMEDVQPNFDVYMLGKLLWCMVAGKMKLPREYHRQSEYDLAKLFPSSPGMMEVNEILDRCIVERPEECIPSAADLLALIEEGIAAISRQAVLDSAGQFAGPCRMCGRGKYVRHDSSIFQLQPSNYLHGQPTQVGTVVCNVCTHIEFFSPNQPQEAAKKGWKPWRMS